MHRSKQYRESAVYLWLTWIFVALAAGVFYGCCTAMGEAITRSMH